MSLLQTLGIRKDPAINDAAQYAKLLQSVRQQVIDEGKQLTPEKKASFAQSYKRLFEAAQYSRTNNSWTAIDWSPNEELYNDLLLLKIRARDLFANVPCVNNFVVLLQNNVVGNKGFGFRSLVKNAKGSINKTVAKQIEDAWADWCKKENCETSNHYSFNRVLDLALLSLAIDGEILMRKYPGMGKYHFKVQLCHSEQLIITQHNEYLLGIKSDEFGCPVTYAITNRHPSDGYLRYLYIPAEQVIHSYIPYQVLANRGLPMIFPSMTTLRMLQEYRQAELISARIESSRFATYSQQQPDDIDPEVQAEGFMIPSFKKSTVEPGTAEILPPGVELHYPQSTHPTSQFGEFCLSLQKEIASGLNLSYNSLFSDFEHTSFSSMRAAFIQEKAMYEKLQQLLIEDVLTPIFNDFIDCACASGALKLPPVMGSYDYYKACEFIPKAVEFSNPLQQSQAAWTLVENRLMSRTQFCLSQGYTYENVCRDIRREQEIEKEQNVNFLITPKNSVISPAPADDVNTPVAGIPTTSE
jgi:lambda family phage portal protein